MSCPLLITLSRIHFKRSCVHFRFNWSSDFRLCIVRSRTYWLLKELCSPIECGTRIDNVVLALHNRLHRLVDYASSTLYWLEQTWVFDVVIFLTEIFLKKTSTRNNCDRCENCDQPLTLWLHFTLWAFWRYKNMAVFG